MSDTITYHTSHCDTIINNQHVVIDTFKNDNSTVIEKNIFNEEIRIIEKLIDKPDFGSSAVSILIVVFVVYSIMRSRSKRNG